MPTITYPGWRVNTSTRQLLFKPDIGSRVWSHSPRRNGELVLVSNPFRYQRAYCTFVDQGAPHVFPNGRIRYMNLIGPYGTSELTPEYNKSPNYSNFRVPRSLNNKVLSRFQRNVNGSQAALGITLATWRESTDMIYQRTHGMSKLADERIKYLKTKKGRKIVRRQWRKINREFGPQYDPASMYLEGIFGWAPLFQDVHDSLETLVTHDELGSKWIRASGTQKFNVRERPKTTNFGRKRLLSSSYNCTLRVTQGAQVVVKNPNLFLANKLGLVNAATVAWDLVPWSFVVNMFLNVNQMISSISPYAGVDLKNQSLTYSVRGFLEIVHAYQDSGWKDTQVAKENYLIINKQRTKETLSYQWQLKMPDASLSLAGIASALVEQKFKTITKLVRALRP